MVAFRGIGALFSTVHSVPFGGENLGGQFCLIVNFFLPPGLHDPK